MKVTTTAKHERATQRNAMPVDFSAWMFGPNPALENWAQLSSGLMKNAADLSQEIMTFSQTRLQADLAAWNAVASCHNPTEFFECQKRFAQEATAQYFDEAGRLASRMLSLMSGSAAPFQQGQASKS